MGRGAATNTIKLQIGVSSDRDGKAYARLGNARFVYLVAADVIERTLPYPLTYRQKMLREIPAAAKFSALSITDLKTNTKILEQTIDQENPGNAALQTVFKNLRTLQASNFTKVGFPELLIVAGEERPWRYLLDATITLPGGGGEQTESLKLFFTERVCGNMQYAGSP